MKFLVLNSGSSSIKFKLYTVNESDQFSTLCEGQVDRIGIEGSNLKTKCSECERSRQFIDIPNHKAATDLILQLLVNCEKPVIKSLEELSGIGHRVVHGGEDFKESVLITDDVINAIDRNSILAPLHNPPNLMGIEAMKSLLPNTPQVAVFDTAIHQSMPKKAFLYAIPREQYTNYKIRRYGFHGTSHGYVAEQAAEKLGKPLEALKIITCHLGNGGSITAFQDGKSIDTSMGFTPLAGIMMGTRSGDMDPYIPLHILETQGMSASSVSSMMNKQGGLLAIAGKSDMRDIIASYHEGDQDCTDAIEMFIYRIQKYIGSYIAAMNGVDAIIFTAGVGENNAELRNQILSNFGFIGLEIDTARNEANEPIITTDDSSITGMCIHTNEELVIALDTYNLVSK